MATAPHPEPPEMRTLEMVVPVVQRQERAGWVVTCIAVEVYDDGFRATFRVYGAGRAAHPELKLSVGDDRGNDYRSWGCAGNGQGTAGACDWRLSCRCVPHLDPMSRDLRIVVDEVRSVEYDPDQRQLVVKQADRGPWSFSVPLPQLPMGKRLLP